MLNKSRQLTGMNKHPIPSQMNHHLQVQVKVQTNDQAAASMMNKTNSEPYTNDHATTMQACAKHDTGEYKNALKTKIMYKLQYATTIELNACK
jgi:hypothetical protein